MRLYRTAHDGEVDLDDLSIYSHLPNTTEELRKLIFSEIGYCYCYVNYWHADFFEHDNAQQLRIENLITKFTSEERNNLDNITWYQEQVFLFQDEIENMC